ncbi:MAG: septum formation initiator family protein [Lachnospiraceae bacterium]|nr:septum formation initiator family protein [Lachnospiraceae bacterium]
MKITTDYTIGNTAIQIVNTGKRIKVVDVEKEKMKKRFLKKILIVAISGAMAFTSCLYFVNLQHKKVFLNKQVYALQGQIEQLERENSLMQRENDENLIVDYDAVYKKARKLGMIFPSNEQTYTYRVDKSTAVRMNDDIREES